MKKYCVNLLRKTLLKKVFFKLSSENIQFKIHQRATQPFGGFYTKSLWKGVWGRTFLQKGFPQWVYIKLLYDRPA